MMARLLSPPGTGAIAVIEAVGPDAYEVVKRLFSKPLPSMAPLRRRFFGQLAGDDVILAVFTEDRIEIHCHGGVKIVELILKTLEEAGCTLGPPATNLLAKATTRRTAGILLDQLQGSFRQSLREEHLDRLSAFSNIGRHLLAPWTIAIAGPPNAGKSTLINALLGYERVVVSPVPGTTRDAVAVSTALGGWPVELLDTAGLRASGDELEADGIRRAKEAIAEADLTIWLTDATVPVSPDFEPSLRVVNKCDLPDAVVPAGSLGISALTGLGLKGLIEAIVMRLVPVEPLAGDAVPYTPELADTIDAARAAAAAGKTATTRGLLESCRSISLRHEAEFRGEAA